MIILVYVTDVLRFPDGNGVMLFFYMRRLVELTNRQLVPAAA